MGQAGAPRGLLPLLMLALISQATTARAQAGWLYQSGLRLRAWSDGSSVTDFPADYSVLPAASLVVDRLVGTARCATTSECMVGDGGAVYPKNVVAQLTGELSVSTEGYYTFFMTATANSKLWVDGSVSLDADGCDNGWLGGAAACMGVQKKITLWLIKGWHPLRMDYYQATGAGSLSLQYSATGIAKQYIPTSALRVFAPPFNNTSPPPPPSPPASICPLVGSATLVLTSATDTTAAYPTCFARFSVTVDSACTLTVTPPTSAVGWFYSSLWSAVPMPDTQLQQCPVDPLPGGPLTAFTASAVGAALQKAMAGALFGGSFAGVTGVTVGADNVRITAAAPSNTLAYSVVYGSLGTVLVAGASPCQAGACLFQSSCPAGRYVAGTNPNRLCALCPPGSSCAGGTASFVGCVAGRAARVGSSSCSACAAGSYTAATGQSHCALCDAQEYQPSTGRTSCQPCPADSYAHFPGSTVCVSCFYGQPVVVAGPAGLTDMKLEQPSPGSLVAQLPATPAQAGCGFSPFTATCASLAGRALAVEVDQTCAVLAYVLGDSGCSQADSLTRFDGHFATATVLFATSDQNGTAGTAVGLRMNRTSSTSVDVTTFQFATQLGAELPTLAACTDAAAVPAASATCPPGTAPEANPQAQEGISVYRARQCAPCPPGYECSNGTTRSCSMGYFNSRIGAAVCMACPDLPPNPNESPCGDPLCYAVKPPDVVRTYCTACAAGTYQPVPGSPVCLRCPAGTYRAYGTLSTMCVDCPPGTYSGDGAAACTLCKLGTAAPAWATPIDAQSRGCPACTPGFYADERGLQQCKSCPANSFSNVTMAANCTQCGPGEVTISTYVYSAPTFCIKCPLGTYATSEDYRCSSCPAGFETGINGPGGYECMPCKPGHYNPVPNAGVCTPCPPRTYAATDGARSCRVCDGGLVTGLMTTVTGQRGWAATGATKCDACPARLYRPSTWTNNTCTACPPGHETKTGAGATNCLSCQPGWTLRYPNDTACTWCPVGTYANQSAWAGACAKCPIGTFAPDEGNPNCFVCEPGTYQPSIGKKSCIECPAGTANPEPMSSSASACVPCLPGTSNSYNGTDVCPRCEGGTYQNLQGQLDCKACPAGFACPQGSAAPAPCDPGYYSEGQQPYCTPCDVGFTSDANATSCYPCPPGSECSTQAQMPAALCTAGTYAYTNATTSLTSCLPCPRNTYTTQGGQTHCLACSTDSWTGGLTGQITCWPKTALQPPP